MKLLVLAGSARAQSFNRQLAKQAAAIGEQLGAQVTLLELSDFAVPLYNGDLEATARPEDVVRLKEIFDAHPAWVICSPEYNGSYTALLKNTVDWVSSPIKGHPIWGSGTKAFEGKVVGLLSASPGGLGGLRSLGHLATLLLQLQCWVAPKRYALGGAGSAFDEAGQLVNPDAKRQVQGVVEQTLVAARALNGLA